MTCLCIWSHFPTLMTTAKDEEWYYANHGLDYANKVADHVRQNPKSVNDPDAVLYDLDTMITVLTEAASRGLQWHLQIDF